MNLLDSYARLTSHYAFVLGLNFSFSIRTMSAKLPQVILLLFFFFLLYESPTSYTEKRGKKEKTLQVFFFLAE